MTEVKMPLSPKQAAERCGVRVTVIYSAIANGTLRARHKVGTSRNWWILEEDMVAWASGGMFGEESSCTQ